jgi:hypothetical protein
LRSPRVVRVVVCPSILVIFTRFVIVVRMHYQFGTIVHYIFGSSSRVYVVVVFVVTCNLPVFGGGGGSTDQILIFKMDFSH